MTCRTRELINENLQRKGFKTSNDGDHMYFIYYSNNGKKTAIHTKMSRGTKYKALNDSLLGLMCKQCKLPKVDFLQLVDCPLTREEYEVKLQAQGVTL